MTEFRKTELLYENPLAGADDVRDFRMEGNVAVTFPRRRMRLENAFDRDEATHEHGNFLFWCPLDFSDNIAVSWDFRPLSDCGLAMFWVAARGRGGEDLFAPGLAPRNGNYKQYHHGDINALHVSYYRRNPSEIGFRTCNLRKSYGFHLVAQGGDPLPDAEHAKPAYRLEVVKAGARFRFAMNDVVLFDWLDDGVGYGPVLQGGKIGFRQMAGLIAEYANLQVHAVE
ncbi:MAG: DUF1961 family protein [Kiritimatiellia bacterium]|nr:YesU family protein [Lentisphaerota bacterium]